MTNYRQQQLIAAALIEQGATAEQIAAVFGWVQPTEPKPSHDPPTESGDNQTLTEQSGHDMIYAIGSMISRVIKRRKKAMDKWVVLYSIDNCIANETKTKVKAVWNDTEKTYEISRRTFLRACKKIGADEHTIRCNDKDVWTQTGRGEGLQWYKLCDGNRSQTW